MTLFWGIIIGMFIALVATIGTAAYVIWRATTKK